jgi:carnitine-CoA ligase
MLVDKVPYEDRTIPKLIDRAASTFASAEFLSDGRSRPVAFADLPAAVGSVASGLRSLGITAGMTVGLYLGNRTEFVLGWWGAAWCGGIGVPIHAQLTGAFLSTAVNHCECTVMVTDAERLAELVKVASELVRLTHLVVVDKGSLPAVPGISVLDWGSLTAHGPASPAPVVPSDAATIMYTSGTTGAPKGVVKSHHFEFFYSSLTADGQRLDPARHHWSCLPISHVAAANHVVFASLLAGSRVTLASRFSASNFWAEVAASGATDALVVGAISNILMKSTEEPHTHSALKYIYSVPPPADPRGFERRFGVELISQGFGMTEIYPAPQQAGQQDWSKPIDYIGHAHSLMEVRVVDDDGFDVPCDGSTVGELVARPRVPHGMMTEYWKDPESTAQAWRDLWFHTGDSATMDRDGGLYYKGRRGDRIRRRGENISAVDIEAAALSFEAVAEAAAYGIPSELGEEDVKLDVVWVVRTDAEGALPALLAHLEGRLPRSMWPRYVQGRPSLPKTASQKVQKFVLRGQGLSAGVFDREASRR